jgi:hypothetical protein
MGSVPKDTELVVSVRKDSLCPSANTKVRAWMQGPYSSYVHDFKGNELFHRCNLNSKMYVLHNIQEDFHYTILYLRLVAICILYQ